MKFFSEHVDELVALIMAVGGVMVLLGGIYGICMSICTIAIEELLLVSSALLGPSTGYLFGKSVPRKEDSDIKDVLMRNMQK
jgi:hypothetical protein